ncbi:MAG TPA: NAD-dependent epimerase/dehydratase family protein [Gemmatimonadales bacterium]|nr:NAD-dependent epimerase/dehydratase family protein [Gemmatimonadales bacterium]
MNRRVFIETSVAASATLLWPSIAVRHRVSAAPKNVLILGGTLFLGPQIVEAAVAAGHHVTLFNRGITNSDLFPHVEKLRGLRSATAAEENWDALGRREWDVVVDVWPSDPALAESAARLLRQRTRHYLYVSSIAAYDRRGFAEPGLTEEGALTAWDSSAGAYNRGKAESERRLNALIGERLTIVRPVAIKGARDDSPDLLTWLRRARAGGRHIAPGTGDTYVQLVDVKDVARFLVLAIDRSLYGTFNVAGDAMTLRQFLDRCKVATDSTAEFVWVPQEFLHQQGLDPDRAIFPSDKFPFWHPEPARRGFYQISNSKAVNAGWIQRPFTETALDALWWMDAFGPGAFQWTDPLPAEVEQRVLSQWLAR